MFHSSLSPERCVAGEIFKAGVSITTADDGTGAIRVAAQVWRNLCKNLIIIDRAEQATVTQHVGRNLRDVVQAGIERAMKSVSHFADKWSEATVENVLEWYGADDVATIFRALVANRAVHVPGFGNDEMVERLQRRLGRRAGLLQDGHRECRHPRSAHRGVALVADERGARAGRWRAPLRPGLERSAPAGDVL